MLIKDRLYTIDSQRKYTDEGYLIVDAVISRVGIQEYYAIELGMTDVDPYKKIKINRSPEEVFSDKSIDSFMFNPVTNNHPPEGVDATNSAEYSVGFEMGQVKQDGDLLKARLKITNQDTIKAIESGKKELSNGYQSEIDLIPGVYNGDHYDGSQKNIVGNHIAIVDKGRCGIQCKISDTSNEEVKYMPKITIDGVDFEAPEGVCQAVTKLNDRLQTIDAEKEELEKQKLEQKKKDEKEKDSMKAESKETTDSLNLKIKELTDKVPTPEQLDTLVDNRMNVRDSALKINPNFKYNSKDCETIRAEIVAETFPELDIKTLDASNIQGRFDVLVSSAPTPNTNVKDNNPLNVVIRDSVIPAKKQIKDARAQFSERSKNAWRNSK